VRPVPPTVPQVVQLRALERRLRARGHFDQAVDVQIFVDAIEEGEPSKSRAHLMSALRERRGQVCIVPPAALWVAPTVEDPSAQVLAGCSLDPIQDALIETAGRYRFGLYGLPN
jgi:hypothetical protein